MEKAVENNGRSPIIAGIGELLWDLLPGLRQLGGAPANFAYHAQVLGGRGIVVSCIGDDALGREIRERLGGQGFELGYIAVDRDYPTGTASVKLDEAGKPDFTIHGNVAWDFIPTTSDILELAARVDAVCFGTLARRSSVSSGTIAAFLGNTRSDCLRVFDVNIRQNYYSEAIVRAGLVSCNVLKLNDEELPIVNRILSLEGSESEVLKRLCLEYSLRAAVLTRGERGSLIVTPETAVVHPGLPPEKIVDTVGVGDAFTAAVAVGLLKNKDLKEISEHANRLASHVCSRSGAMPSVPDSLRS
ncbi:MAG: carbohydrate kinase [Proteobacteria bacterium]|nr:carbohydrate kinase [Pseudomonadota bacterium]